MSYARVNWNSTTTYVSSENLNVMDKGIKDCDDAIVALSIDLQAQINSVNNNLMLLSFTGTTLSYGHASGMSMLELPGIGGRQIISIIPQMKAGGLVSHGIFTNDWGSKFLLLTDGSNNAIPSTEVTIVYLAL